MIPTKRLLILLVCLLVCVTTVLAESTVSLVNSSESVTMSRYAKQNNATSGDTAIPKDMLYWIGTDDIGLPTIPCRLKDSGTIFLPILYRENVTDTGEEVPVSLYYSNDPGVTWPLIVINDYLNVMLNPANSITKAFDIRLSTDIDSSESLYMLDTDKNVLVVLPSEKIAIGKSEGIACLQYTGECSGHGYRNVPVFSADSSLVGVVWSHSDDNIITIIAMDQFVEALTSGSAGAGSSGGGATAAPATATPAPTAIPTTASASSGATVVQLSDAPKTIDIWQENWWLFALLFVEAMAALLLVVLLLQKKKGAGTAGRKPTLRCYGPLAGKTVALGRGVVLVGRDTSCTICYPSSAQGISRIHCAISVVNGRVMVTDRGSAYGTYLAGGVKLQNGETRELTRGSSIYLGSPNQNAITLE